MSAPTGYFPTRAIVSRCSYEERAEGVLAALHHLGPPRGRTA
jgi:hypothetical protein